MLAAELGLLLGVVDDVRCSSPRSDISRAPGACLLGGLAAHEKLLQLEACWVAAGWELLRPAQTWTEAAPHKLC